MPGFLTDSYYDVILLHGPNSWLCQVSVSGSNKLCLLGLGGGQTAWFEDPLVKGKMETGELAEKDGQ